MSAARSGHQLAAPRGQTSPGSRRSAPEVCQGISSLRIGAQGMPGERMHPQPRAIKERAHEIVTTGESRITGIPCTMVLTVSFVLSPGDLAFLPPSYARPLSRALDTCLGVSGPHDFAVRDHAARQAALPRPPHSDPTSVTVAKRPSFGSEQNRNIFQDRPFVKGNRIYQQCNDVSG
jgi:hypothetical protein